MKKLSKGQATTVNGGVTMFCCGHSVVHFNGFEWRRDPPRDRLRQILDVPAHCEILHVVALGKPKEEVFLEILGPGGDVEDAVQETYLRWHRTNRKWGGSISTSAMGH